MECAKIGTARKLIHLYYLGNKTHAEIDFVLKRCLNSVSKFCPVFAFFANIVCWNPTAFRWFQYEIEFGQFIIK